MDAPQYEEAFEEYEEPSRLPWILFAVAAVAAVAFAVLWYMRGGELNTQATALRAAQAAATAAEAQERTNAGAAETAANAAAARITELETALQTARAQTGGGEPSPILQNTLDELGAASERIAELEAAVTTATQDLASANDSLQRTEQARAALETRFAAAQTQLAEAQAQATATQAGAAAATAATTATAETQARIAEWEERATAAEKNLAETAASVAAFEKQVRDLTAVRDNLTKELASVTTARDEFQAVARTAEENRKAREKELIDNAERQKAELQKQIDAAKKALTEAEAAKAAEVSEAAKAVAAQAKAEAEAVKAKAEAAKSSEPEALKPAAKPEQPAAATVVPATQEWAYVTEENSSAAAPAAEQPKHVFISDPNRAVGQVVQALTDGITFVIQGGKNQRVRPGMVFDVHRRFGGMSRYIGLLLVTRVLDDYSLAVPAYPTRPARICPVTGRVVLDPTRTTSPFVETEDGKSVPLIPAADVGVGSGMPAIGDCVDNPYYNPTADTMFFAGAGVKDNPLVAPLVAGLSGDMVDDRMSADFEIATASDPKSQPRKTAVDALAMYFVPPASTTTAAAE